MLRLTAGSTCASVRSPAETWGKIQIAATPEAIILTSAVRSCDTVSHPHLNHALANLSLQTALRFKALFDEAIEAILDAEPHQHRFGLTPPHNRSDQ